MILGDLADAGIAFKKDGRVVDFHALRQTFVSSLALNGVPLAVAQKLARHSDPRLTANVCTHLNLSDLSRAVASLPPLPEADLAKDGKDEANSQSRPPEAAAG